MDYAKIEYLSISGVIFLSSFWGLRPDPLRRSAPGLDLPLLFKLHDI